MFYHKTYALSASDRRRYRLSDFSGLDPRAAANSLPCNYCTDAFNFAFESGTLTQGLSFSPFEQTIGAAAERVPDIATLNGNDELFTGKLTVDGKTRDVLFVSEPGKLHYLVLGDDDAVWQTKTDVAGDKFCSAVGYLHDGDDLMLFGGKSTGVYLLSGEDGGTLVANALPIRDICVYNERVFAVVETERPCVWFSDAFDPYEWSVSLDAGGYLYTDGAAGKVVHVAAMGGYLFIVCEYGLYRLAAYGDQTAFSLERIHSDSGRIFGDSVAVCGSSLIFATTDGIFASDGYSVYKLSDRADKLLKGAADVRAVCTDNKWFATMSDGGEKYFRHDGGKGDVLVVLDLDDGNLDVYRSLGVRSLAVLCGSADKRLLARGSGSDSVLALDGSSDGNSAPIRYWRTPEIDFALPCDKKRIVQVECRTSSTFALGIVADGRAHEFRFSPSTPKRLIGIEGTRFAFYIVSRARKIEIAQPQVVVDIISR